MYNGLARNLIVAFYVQTNQVRRKRSREGTPTTGMTLFFTKSKSVMS